MIFFLTEKEGTEFKKYETYLTNELLLIKQIKKKFKNFIAVFESGIVLDTFYNSATGSGTDVREVRSSYYYKLLNVFKDELKPIKFEGE